MAPVTLLANARRAGLRVSVDASGRLLVRGPRRLAPIVEELIERAPDVTKLLIDVDSLERDGTTARLRDFYRALDAEERLRLECEAEEDDALAALVLAAVNSDCEQTLAAEKMRTASSHAADVASTATSRERGEQNEGASSRGARESRPAPAGGSPVTARDHAPGVTAARRPT